jgi:SAM-dependent methyltransferase
MDPEAERALHWRDVWSRRKHDEVSWFQELPETSLDFIARCGIASQDPVIDVGGGASSLAARLAARGHTDVTVLDIAPEALAAARREAGPEAWRIAWIGADVLTWRPQRRYALWHDRAMFHFLTEASDRERYGGVLEAALAAHGHAIIGTFAPDGPDQCSGLPVQRHDADSLLASLGPRFILNETCRHEHRTPSGAMQHFCWSRVSMKLS